MASNVGGVSLRQLADYIRATQAMRSQQGIMKPPESGPGSMAPLRPAGEWSWLFNGGKFRPDEVPQPGYGEPEEMKAYSPGQQQWLQSPIAPWQGKGGYRG